MANNFCGECALLERDRTYWGNEYYCKKDGKYHKLDCRACNSIVKTKQSNSNTYKRPGCYITTIVCNILGYQDDCEVLTMLRLLRESYLKMFDEGRKLLQEYDQVGPLISQKIAEEDNKEKIAAELLQKFIIPCAIYVRSGKYDEATKIYSNMTNMLKVKYGLLNVIVDYNLDTPEEELGKARLRIPKVKEEY